METETARQYFLIISNIKFHKIPYRCLLHTRLFPAISEGRTFITAFTGTSQWSYREPVESNQHYRTHFHLNVACISLSLKWPHPFRFRTNILSTVLIRLMRATYPVHLTFLDFINISIFDEDDMLYWYRPERPNCNSWRRPAYNL